VTPLLLPQGTLLVLIPLSGSTAVTLTPYSARGITQTLEPISGAGGQGSAWLRRDVNGWMRSVADPRFRKYHSTVTCRDGESPCLDGAWLGEQCEVECACELSFPQGAIPQRSAVSGSPRAQGTITYYRPVLTMMVSKITSSFSEYPALYSWELGLEEI
jgi:hypothetical protein